jgi:Zn finger protein HypA/HybF involved in hydrogenase expression
MPFNTNCTNKGCGEYQEPYLDLNDNKVYCSKCDGEILNISQFTKNKMKSFNQIKKDKKEAFSIKCSVCSRTAQPNIVDEKIICGVCKKELTNITEHFKILLKQNLLKSRKDV